MQSQGFRFGLALVAVAVLLTACTYHDPFGGRWQVDPRRTPLPDHLPLDEDCIPQKVGEHKVGGTVYHLIDLDCDGEPDFAMNPATGRGYRIRPAYEPIVRSINGASPVIGLMSGALGDVAAMWEIELGDAFDFNVDFEGMTPAVWRSQYGLEADGRQEYIDTSLMSFGLDINGLSGHVIIPWATDLFIPDHAAYGVSFGMHMLLDPPGLELGPGGLAIGISGHVSDIAAYLLEMSESGFMVLETKDHRSGIVWRIEADRTTLSAELFRNGRYHSSWPIS